MSEYRKGEPSEDDDNDPAVYWGKRVGRVLGLALLIYLIWHLYSTYLAA